MKYLILGGGPAGLTVANRLLQKGETDFLLLEKESEVGGLCRSALVDGAPLDIGGGHFLDTRSPRVCEFLFQFIPQVEWAKYARISKIQYNDILLGYPFESNIWQMKVDDQVAFLESIARAGCNSGTAKPERFVEWISWKLGEKIAEEYMLPYNRKMFGDDLNELGTYWLEKLPSVSFEDTLRSCLMQRPYGKGPGHATFYYPKHHGYGAVWLKMGASLGNRLICGKAVAWIDMETRQVGTQDGEVYQADVIITTVPWRSFQTVRGISEDMQAEIRTLKHSTICIDYHEENLNTDAHWIYYSDPKLSYHRILVRHNFAQGSRGYWTETNMNRVSKESGIRFVNEYAYPLNTLHKPAIMERLLSYAREHGVYGLGRWGEHSHYNSDVTVEKAMDLAEGLLKQGVYNGLCKC